MTRHQITIYSFGYLHDTPPQADATFDLRRLLADPAHVPGGHMLDMRGDRDEEVREFVFATPGATVLLQHVVWTVKRMALLKPVTVAWGCAGGKHRAAAMAWGLADALIDQGCDIRVKHLHAHLPRVIKGEVSTAFGDRPAMPGLATGDDGVNRT